MRLKLSIVKLGWITWQTDDAHKGVPSLGQTDSKIQHKLHQAMVGRTIYPRPPSKKKKKNLIKKGQWLG